MLLPVVGVLEVANTAIEEHADIEAAIAEYLDREQHEDSIGCRRPKQHDSAQQQLS